MSPLLWEHSIASGVVVLKGVAKQQLEGVCQVTGATPLSYLTHCLEVNSLITFHRILSPSFNMP